MDVPVADPCHNRALSALVHWPAPVTARCPYYAWWLRAVAPGAPRTTEMASEEDGPTTPTLPVSPCHRSRCAAWGRPLCPQGRGGPWWHRCVALLTPLRTSYRPAGLFRGACVISGVAGLLLALTVVCPPMSGSRVRPPGRRDTAAAAP